MSMSNTLYFIAPSALPFKEPIVNSADALGHKQVIMEVKSLQNLDAKTWTIGVTMAHDNKYSFTSKTIQYYKEAWLPLPSLEDAQQMTRVKRVIYGLAPGLSIDLHRASGVASGRIMKYIRAFTQPDINFINVTSGGEDGDPLVAMAKSLPGMMHQTFCPDNGKIAYGSDDEYECARDKYGKFTLYATVIHLNDEHRWSREKIADWLDTLYAEGVPLSFEDAIT